MEHKRWGSEVFFFFCSHFFAPQTETNHTLMTNTNEFWLILITKSICEGSTEQAGMGGGLQAG